MHQNNGHPLCVAELLQGAGEPWFNLGFLMGGCD